MDHAGVFAFLKSRLDAGKGCVLVSVVAVEGSSMRNPGTHMGVCEDKSFAGSLSGGCIENAIVAEALDALEEGAPRMVRFGKGSKYLDIRLPCGGGLDIHLQPIGDSELVERALDYARARKPYTISLESGEARFVEGAAPGEHSFVHWPAPRLLILGHGAAVLALAQLARSIEIESSILTPDLGLVERARESGFDAQRLHRVDQTECIASDAWTATVFMFHDHDWEVSLIAAALDSPHFYLGAMGSQKAHAARCEALAHCGVNPAAIQSIRAPLGLFHSSRDPSTLALSALGEIVLAYQNCDFGAEIG